MDWFQPFKHVTYSVGEIYRSVLNLPRNICEISDIKIIPPIKEFALNCDEVEDLLAMYKMIYPTQKITH